MQYGRRVSIEEARQISASGAQVTIVWRPVETLSEAEQYALISHE